MQTVACDTEVTCHHLVLLNEAYPKAPSRDVPPMFCIVIDPEAASFPASPNALCPNCSYNKDPAGEERRGMKPPESATPSQIRIGRNDWGRGWTKNAATYLLHWPSSGGGEQSTRRILTQMSREFWEKEKAHCYQRAGLSTYHLPFSRPWLTLPQLSGELHRIKSNVHTAKPQAAGSRNLYSGSGTVSIYKPAMCS